MLHCFNETLVYSTHLARSLSGEITVGGIFQVAVVSCLVIGYVHLTMVVHPEFPHDDVVHCRGHLAPSIMIARLREFYMCNTYKHKQQKYHKSVPYLDAQIKVFTNLVDVSRMRDFMSFIYVIFSCCG